MTDYYETSYPPSLWESEPVVPATGATAGIPGTWTPAGSTPPANQADLIAGIPNAVVASPATAWTVGQHVVTGNNGHAHWNGTTWVAGDAVFTVVSRTIAAVQEYVESLGEPSDPTVQAEVQRLLDEERANANRQTLVQWLDARLGVV